jgi:hypothetical protein
LARRVAGICSPAVATGPATAVVSTFFAKAARGAATAPLVAVADIAVIVRTGDELSAGVCHVLIAEGEAFVIDACVSATAIPGVIAFITLSGAPFRQTDRRVFPIDNITSLAGFAARRVHEPTIVVDVIDLADTIGGVFEV